MKSKLTNRKNLHAPTVEDEATDTTVETVNLATTKWRSPMITSDEQFWQMMQIFMENTTTHLDEYQAAMKKTIETIIVVIMKKVCH